MAPRAAHVRRGEGEDAGVPEKAGLAKAKGSRESRPRWRLTFAAVERSGERSSSCAGRICGLQTDGRCVEGENRMAELRSAAFSDRDLPIHVGASAGPEESSDLRSPLPPAAAAAAAFLAASSPANAIRRPRIRLLPSRPPGGGPGSQDWSWAKTRARNGMNWEAVGAASRPSPGHSTL